MKWPMSMYHIGKIQQNLIIQRSFLIGFVKTNRKKNFAFHTET